MRYGSGGGVTRYCWDTGFLLAWLMNEPHAPLFEMALIVDRVDAGDAVLVLPVTVVSEVLMTRHPPRFATQFERFLLQPHVDVVNTTLPIARRAARIREIGLAERPRRKLRTPDAQILATATLKRCHVLHTLDARHLLKLDGKPQADGVPIERPSLYDPANPRDQRLPLG